MNVKQAEQLDLDASNESGSTHREERKAQKANDAPKVSGEIKDF